MTPNELVRYASPGRRLAAQLLDGFILYFLIRLAIFSPVLAAPASASQTDILDALIQYPQLPGMLTAALLLIVLLCWTHLGGTPGKLLLDIRVVSVKTGEPPGFGQSLVRMLAYLVSAAPACLGFLWSFWDKRRQGFHDKLSNTIVIEDDESTRSLDQLLEESR